MTWGTSDDEYGDVRLVANSAQIDSGNSLLLPLDVSDIDGDLNQLESLPLDIAGSNRFYDDPTRDNTGVGSPPVDRGAYESNLATSFWSNPLGGSWSTSTNWNGGVPSSTVRAVFDATAGGTNRAFTVTFPSLQSA
jgi:hypothetical protein